MATPRTTSPDLPTPYIGQIVHYVDTNDDHVPVMVTAILEIDGERVLDPVNLTRLNGSGVAHDRFGTQNSDLYHIGTWHEIGAACAQKITEVERNPQKR